MHAMQVSSIITVICIYNNCELYTEIAHIPETQNLINITNLNHMIILISITTVINARVDELKRTRLKHCIPASIPCPRGTRHCPCRFPRPAVACVTGTVTSDWSVAVARHRTAGVHWGAGVTCSSA